MDLNRHNMRKLMELIAFGVLIFLGVQNIDVLLSIGGKALGMISPFLVGGALAFVLNVPMRSIERTLFPEQRQHSPFYRWRRGISLILTLVFLTLLIFVVVGLILPELVKTLKLLAVSVQQTADFVISWVEKQTALYPEITDYVAELKLDWGSLTSKIVTFLRNSVGAILGSTFGMVGGIIGALSDLMISVIFAIYLLLQKETLTRQGKKVLYACLPARKAAVAVSMLQLSNKTFSSFLSGQCVEAVILGSMFFVSMLLFQLPYALLVSVIVGVTALIPVFGAFIGGGISFVFILMVDSWQAVLFLVLFFVLQQIEGNLIYPHVVGGSVGLPSIWVLAAVTIGGSLMGVAGMLLFIPLCSVAYAVLREVIDGRLRSRQVPPSCWEKAGGAAETEEEKSEAEGAAEKDEKELVRTNKI